METSGKYLTDGAADLLLETCSILNKIDAQYVIVGGWSPYLLNKSKYPHPGTKDVDVLFRDGYISGQLSEVFSAFFHAGFAPSAKHPFQLLKSYEIDDQKFVFNVDILHPSESSDNPELFVDHFKFGIREVAGSTEHLAARSIVLPSADILFNGLSNEVNISALLGRPDPPVRAPLMNLVGLIATKSESFLNAKRPRDAFDLFLAFNQEELHLEESLEQLSIGNSAVEDLAVLSQMMEIFSKNIKTEHKRFNKNVSRFAEVGSLDAAKFVSERHASVVSAVGEANRKVLERRLKK